MNRKMIKMLILAAPLAFSSQIYAGSNNGYTSAANVYTGSSSRGWYGGGVAHVLAEWRKEADVPEESATTPVKAEEGEAEGVEEVNTMDAPVSPEVATAPETPVAPEKPEAGREISEAPESSKTVGAGAPEMPAATVEETAALKSEVTEDASAENAEAVTPTTPERPEAIEAPDSPVEPKMDSD